MIQIVSCNVSYGIPFITQLLKASAAYAFNHLQWRCVYPPFYLLPVGLDVANILTVDDHI